MVSREGISLGTKAQKTEIEEKQYNMINKRYVKWNVKLTTQNPLRPTIGQNVKIATKYQKKRKR